MDAESINSSSPSKPVSWSTEFIGALATFFTMSYIFILNPILLSRVGIELEVAFVATIASAAASTLLMGLYAKAPFAVAPAPSLTVFFTAYVCGTLGLSWQAGMAAVIVSGLLSVAVTALAIRAELIKQMPQALQYSIIFILAGFLTANGLNQAKLTKVSDAGFLELGSAWTSNGQLVPLVLIMLTGLFVSIILQLKPIGFKGSPIVGVFAATTVAAYFGIVSATKANFSIDTIGTVLFEPKPDFAGIFTWSVFPALLILFIIDFFGGVGKFVGLFQAMKDRGVAVRDDQKNRSLYVDGVGNILGGWFGASSLAVFVSSAAGVTAGARTGLAAIFIAGLMLSAMFLIPVVGAIPVEATSGVLIFIAAILIPWRALVDPLRRKNELGVQTVDVVVFACAAVISFVTFNLEMALAGVFIWYTISSVQQHGFKKELAILYASTALLALAVFLRLILD